MGCWLIGLGLGGGMLSCLFKGGGGLYGEVKNVRFTVWSGRVEEKTNEWMGGFARKGGPLVELVYGKVWYGVSF